MTLASPSRRSLAVNPLDVVEQVMNANHWSSNRRDDQELTAQVPGRWCDYSLFFAWNEDVDAIHFTCAFDVRVPTRRLGPVYELLALINERLWLGHFGMWSEEGLPLFRHSLPLRGGGGPSVEQMEDLLDTGIRECERFYPAFQYVIWGGKTAGEAVEVAMVETVGEA